jgi:hypothetical protein
VGGSILGGATNLVSGALNGVFGMVNAGQDLVTDNLVEPLMKQVGGNKWVEDSNLAQEYEDKSVGPVADLATKYATVMGKGALTDVAGSTSARPSETLRSTSARPPRSSTTR